MKRVGLVVHPRRGPATDAANRMRPWLGERGIEARVFEETTGGDEAPLAAFVDGLDVVVSLGGDGTFLRAARIAWLGDVPVLGVKVGRVGFLTEVEPADAQDLLGRVLDGTATIEERLAVIADAEGASLAPQWGLNEVMVEKRARHRIVRLAVFVDDEYVTTFSGDAVIVATPTGSTAYSFAAGGPIVSPDVGCVVVTPVAAHMVFDRSLVLGADERVAIEVIGEEEGLISADGRQSLELPVGARVDIARAPRPVKLVRSDDRLPFVALVRTKFGLPGGDGATV